MPRYLYGMRHLRGFGPGCQPGKGLIGREDDPAGRYNDVLVYDRELEPHELDSYELDFMGVEPDTTTHDSIPAKTGKNDEDRTSGDLISRTQAIDKFIDELEEIFSDIREREVDDSVCGLCEYDGAYMGQSGDWCNECPGFDRDDCFKLSDKIRKEWTDEIIKALPSAQPEHKTGRWISDDSGLGIKCNKCGKSFSDYVNAGTEYMFLEEIPNFCPMCGAKMEGGEQDE